MSSVVLLSIKVVFIVLMSLNRFAMYINSKDNVYYKFSFLQLMLNCLLAYYLTLYLSLKILLLSSDPIFSL